LLPLSRSTPGFGVVLRQIDAAGEVIEAPSLSSMKISHGNEP
jgi:hypothetical protein